MTEEESRHHCPHCKKELESYYNPDPISFGAWETEKESVDFVRSLLLESGLFTLYEQVDGYPIQPRLFSEDKTFRIDFILSPTSKLKQSKQGWDVGPIGLECKKSGVKLNLPLAQAMDYSRTVWCLENGFKFMCQYFFIWPYFSLHGLAASIMAQQRIGTLEYQTYQDRSWDVLRFKCGEQKALYWKPGADEVDVGTLNFGHKAGSR